jgi:hypothetical protein
MRRKAILLAQRMAIPDLRVTPTVRNLRRPRIPNICRTITHISGYVVDDEDIPAIKADLAQMKAEHAQARADRKAKIQEKIDQLNSKLQAQLQKAKDQRQAAERDAQLKLEALKAKDKAAAAKASA